MSETSRRASGGFLMDYRALGPAPDSAKAQARAVWSGIEICGRIPQERGSEPRSRLRGKRRPAEGPPDFIATPLMREVRKDPSAVPTIGLTQIHREIDHIADLGPRFEDALTELRRRRMPELLLIGAHGREIWLNS